MHVNRTAKLVKQPLVAKQIDRTGPEPRGFAGAYATVGLCRPNAAARSNRGAPGHLGPERRRTFVAVVRCRPAPIRLAVIRLYRYRLAAIYWMGQLLFTPVTATAREPALDAARIAPGEPGLRSRQGRRSRCLRLGVHFHRMNPQRTPWVAAETLCRWLRGSRFHSLMAQNRRLFSQGSAQHFLTWPEAGCLGSQAAGASSGAWPNANLGTNNVGCPLTLGGEIRSATHGTFGRPRGPLPR